ncbi:hypothetical protein BDK92_0959 [Micromonospora pisi]|uniref:Excreted virulence factor EspC (Type VII ESX diderm) n=1 Tax=Micromonospora pisi TaxID=589240 RepID=A0A495JDU6_9ACTN|nr:hypothetical protein [Micromonospora pisi]RKR86698.1 hypothetical protein BDK92_0959 [Micromonospora pisi]
MTGFEINPESLRDGGATIGDTARSFGDRLQAFRAELASYDGAWGDDAIGALIGAPYQAVSEWAFDCYRAAADELLSAGTDLGVMADGYEGADESASGLFQNLHRQLG